MADKAQLIGQFKRTFKRPFTDFFDGVCGLDVVKFDEEVAKPVEGESTREAIVRLYGEGAAVLCEELFNIFEKARG